MIVRWMPQALDDLAAIRQYIARDNPRAARGWVSKLEHRTNGAGTGPLAGRVVPELRRADVRDALKPYESSVLSLLGLYTDLYRLRPLKA